MEVPPEWRNALLAAVVVGVPVLVILKRMLNRSSKKKKIYPKDTVILHQIGRGPAAPSLSPFPLKLETYLRMARIPYQNVNSLEMSSKGKTPWMEYNGEAVADSQFCIDFLNKKLGIDLNQHLSSEERAVARAFQKMTEEDIYWGLVLHRWVYPEGREFICSQLPSRLLYWYVSRKVKQSTHGHGMGRHTRVEVFNILQGDIRALSDYLGNKSFLMGEDPSEVDCTVFGMLSQILWHSPGLPTEKLMKDELTNLRDYCFRMKETFWPDWDECIKK